MHFKGTAHRYGRDIDTDVIIPARYLNSSEPEWLAKSFARIFYRNSINTGLAIMECPEAVDAIKQGDVVDVDADAGVITNTTTGETFKAQPFPPFIREIIEEGGLINRTKKVLGK